MTECDVAALIARVMHFIPGDAHCGDYIYPVFAVH